MKHLQTTISIPAWLEKLYRQAAENGTLASVARTCLNSGRFSKEIALACELAKQGKSESEIAQAINENFTPNEEMHGLTVSLGGVHRKAVGAVAEALGITITSVIVASLTDALGGNNGTNNGTKSVPE